jgi:hypothetical protein
VRRVVRYVIAAAVTLASLVLLVGAALGVVVMAVTLR